MTSLLVPERRAASPRERTLSRSVTLWAAVAAAFIMTAFAVLATVNADEGWYALAGRLVAGGASPYRDFMFTQAPLAAYVFAPGQVLAPGILAARLTSVCFAVGTIALGTAVARHMGSVRAAVAVAALLLVGLFPALPYWLSITKTYALGAFCVTLAVAALLHDGRDDRRLPLAAFAALAFVGTRTSAIGFAVPIVWYCVSSARDARTRRRVLVVTGLFAALFAAIVASSGVDRVVWNLWGFHQLASDGGGPLERLARTTDYVRAWPGVALLAAAAAVAVVVDGRVRAWARAQPAYSVVTLGLLGFLVANATGGAFHADEYAVPAIPATVVLAILVLDRCARGRTFSRPASIGALVIVAVVGVPSSLGKSYIGRPGWTGSPAGSDALVRCVRAHSSPHDHVLALALADVVVAAETDAAPGTAAGIFSYEAVSASTARRDHVINQQVLLHLVESHHTRVVVLSDIDESVFARQGFFMHQSVSPSAHDALVNALRQGYEPVCTGDVVRQLSHQRVFATVYARR